MSEIRLVCFESFKYSKVEERVESLRFRYPVRLHRVRVVPVGQDVECSKARYTTGVTQPTSLDLKMFGRVFGERLATFQKLAPVLDVSETKNRTSFPLNDKILTDHVAITGRFSGLTVMIYGEVFTRKGQRLDFSSDDLPHDLKGEEAKVEFKVEPVDKKVDFKVEPVEVEPAAEPFPEEEEEELMELPGNVDPANVEPISSRICVADMELNFPRRIGALTLPYMPESPSFPLSLEPSDSPDTLQRQLEEKIRSVAQELITYCEQVWRYSQAGQQMKQQRSNRKPRVSPMRARDLIVVLHRCFAANNPCVPSKGQPETTLTSHTPSNILTAEIVTSELPVFEALYMLLASRKERRHVKDAKGKLRVGCSPFVLEAALRLVLKAVEFQPCAEKFAGQRKQLDLPFAEECPPPKKGADVLVGLLSSAELNLTQEVEALCVSLLRCDRFYNNGSLLQDQAKEWGKTGRQSTTESAGLDLGPLRSSYASIQAVHQCLEEEDCLRSSLDTSVAAHMTLATMKGGALLTSKATQPKPKADVYQFVKVANGLSLVPSLCDIIIAYCTISESMKAKEEPSDTAEGPLDAASVKALEESVEAACQLFLQMMASSQGLVLISQHPRDISRLFSCIMPKFGSSSPWSGVPLPSADNTLAQLKSEGCEAHLHALAGLLPYHIQSLLCVDALLGADIDSLVDLFSILHQLSYESLASTKALAQVLATNEGMDAIISALDRWNPTKPQARYLLHTMSNCLRMSGGLTITCFFCKRLSDTASSLMRSVEAASNMDTKKSTVDQYADLKDVLRDIRAWAEPARILIDLGLEDFLRYIQAQVLDFKNLFKNQHTNPVTAMLLTRLVSAMSLIALLGKESRMVCIAALDRLRVTPDRETDIPSLIVDMMGAVLKTALLPCTPLAKGHTPQDFHDKYKANEKYAQLFYPMMDVVHTFLVILQKANIHNKRWHNIQPTVYCNVPMLKVILQGYIELVFKGDLPKDHVNMEIIQSIVIQLFSYPYKESVQPKDPMAKLHTINESFAGPDIARTLNDNHDAIMKLIKEAPRNHYAIMYMLCRILHMVDKSIEKEHKEGPGVPKTDTKCAKDGPDNEKQPSVDSGSVYSLSSISVDESEGKRTKHRKTQPRKRAKYIHPMDAHGHTMDVHGHPMDQDAASSDSESSQSGWSNDSSADSEDPKSGQRGLTSLRYQPTTEHLYHNLGNVIVDAIGYSLKTATSHATATYILRCAHYTAERSGMDKSPERLKLHQSIRQELESHHKSDYGRQLLHLIDKGLDTVPDGYFSDIAIREEDNGESNGIELHDLLHSSIVDEFMHEMKIWEEQGGLADFQSTKQRERNDDEDPHKLEGKAWEKGSRMPVRPGFDPFRDGFRDRKPNTSRPPSAHVDDFGAVPLTIADNNIDGVSGVTGFDVLQNQDAE